ncbi:hypothetical protein KKH82_02780 [Patescibacteria group bacterium]|nr:hypothetical protein [Patescibacteria group bacterium]
MVFTHYNNRRGIVDQKDLPPCSRVIVKGEEKYQDIWTDNKDQKSK